MDEFLHNTESESSPLIIPTIPLKEYPPLKTEYEVGDCVKIENGEFPTRFGIINRIGTEPDPNFYGKIWFKSFITVEEAYGKPPLKHHSENEIVKYYDIEKEDIKAVTWKVEILFYYDYIEKYHKEAAKKGLKRIEIPKNVYFYRQHKVIPSGELYPALEPNWIWRKILNINDTLFECPKQWGKLYHVTWFLASSVRSCCKWGWSIDLSIIGLITPKIERKRDEKSDSKQLEDNKASQEIDSQKSNPSKSHSSDHIDSTKSSQSSEKSGDNKQKKLAKFIERKRKEIKKEDKNSNLKPDALKRKKVREQLLFLFLKSIEDWKSNGIYFSSFNDIKITSGSSYQKSYELACQFANLIETEVYMNMNKEISESYSKKIFLIYNSLKNPENKILMEQLLKLKIDVEDLVNRSAEELVSEELKKKREKVEKHVIEETLLIKEPLTVVSKSHKGEEVIELSKNNQLDESSKETSAKKNKVDNLTEFMVLTQPEIKSMNDFERFEEEQIETNYKFIEDSKGNLIKKIESMIESKIVQNKLTDIVNKIEVNCDYKEIIDI